MNGFIDDHAPPRLALPCAFLPWLSPIARPCAALLSLESLCPTWLYTAMPGIALYQTVLPLLAVLPCTALTCPCPTLPLFALPCRYSPCIALPFLVLRCFSWTFPALSLLALPCATLPSPSSSCPALHSFSCIVLPHLTLPLFAVLC